MQENNRNIHRNRKNTLARRCRKKTSLLYYQESFSKVVIYFEDVLRGDRGLQQVLFATFLFPPRDDHVKFEFVVAEFRRSLGPFVADPSWVWVLI